MLYQKFFFLLTVFLFIIIIGYASIMGIFLDSIWENFTVLLEIAMKNFAPNTLWSIFLKYLPYSIKAFLWFFLLFSFGKFFLKK